MEKSSYRFIYLILASFGYLSFGHPTPTYGESKCFEIFNSEIKRWSAKSPSRLNPIFRLLHDSFCESGNDGLNYLIPYGTGWKSQGRSGKVKIKSVPAKEGQPEGMIHFSIAREKESNSVVLVKAVNSVNQMGASFTEFPPLWGHATGVRFRVSSSDPNQIHTLIIESSEKPLKLSFKAPKVPTDLLIPIPNGDFSHDAFASGIFFQWPKGNKSEFDLNIYGPIVFERDVTQENTKLLNYLYNHFDLKRDIFSGESIAMKLEVKTVLALAIKNLFQSENQEKALRIAELGEDAIWNEMVKIGIYSEFPLNKKIDRTTFFVTSHSNNGNIREMEKPRIPVEIGDFSKEHGRDSHALQLIAMTSGLTPEQIDIFMKRFYRRIFLFEVNRWAAWDMVFDAPGDSAPNSPLWWRKQLEQRGLINTKSIAND